MKEMSTIYRMTRAFMKGIPSQNAADTVQDDLPEATKLLRAKLNLEETFEKINKGFGIEVFLYDGHTGDPHKIVAQGPNANIAFEVVRSYNSVKLLDGAADQAVINAGDLIEAGLTDQAPQRIVGDNNLLKLGKGTIDEAGKLVKHPDHPKPALADEVERQRETGAARFKSDRERFEEWAVSEGLSPMRHSVDTERYSTFVVQLAWDAWQTAQQ